MQFPVKIPVRPSAESPAEFRAAIEPIEARYDYVADRLTVFVGGVSYFEKPAFRAGGDLIGRTPKNARRLVETIRRRGGAKPFLDFISGVVPQRVPPLPSDAVRHVYYARVTRFPHVIKIGISGNLERRMQALRWETGQEHEVYHSHLGTLLDEALAHRVNEKRHIAREWFFDPDTDNLEIPSWLPMGPRAMFEQITRKSA